MWREGDCGDMMKARIERECESVDLVNAVVVIS